MANNSSNSNLTNAKNAKNDEFYTQYHDIEKEINAYLEYNPDVFKGKTHNREKGEQIEWNTL